VAGEWRFGKAALLAWLSRPEPAKLSDKDRLGASIGVWKDDPTADAVIESIERDRKCHPAGGK
jgi:hypothetical protein